MATFRKPNMSKFNSQMRKLKSATSQFERDANRAMRELKSVERKARSYQSKLRSTSTPALVTMPSLYLGASHENPVDLFPYDDYGKEYDVFISHASEDKDEVARPLAQALRENGLTVWYDEFELRIGDSLRRKIDKGIANSNFGVIVISRNFINKGWTNYELDGLITRAVSGEQTMLPVWHNITKREVINYSPSLADKLARSTTEFTVEEIADEIADLIRERKGT
ncbi:MAG TPA: toll/interleukin-1 receptor domain-containing protein [Candidatus Fournierella merdigallinarum]|nr:toll/interleukin-1 receptor domain-containing protein [Candidatus Fournierella merdigallinarum]